MAERGDYQVCSRCPRSKDCDYCSQGYRNDLNRSGSSGLVDLAVGVATGIVVGNIVEEVFDFFD